MWFQPLLSKEKCPGFKIESLNVPFPQWARAHSSDVNGWPLPLLCFPSLEVLCQLSDSPKIICSIIIIIKLNVQDSKTHICHIYHLNLE